MEESVLPFRNPENFAKCLMLYYQPGTNVLIQTLQWLYVGNKPIENNLIDLAKAKANNIDNNEKTILRELAGGKRQLVALDLTLLYKIIQIKCNLAPKNDVVWTKGSPKEKQDELEHLLFRLKDGRNNLAHPDSQAKNITDADLEDRCDEMKKLLTAILQGAGQKGEVDEDKINEIFQQIQLEMESIVRGKNMSEAVRKHLKKTILEDLKASFSEESKSYFEAGLSGYSAPYLHTLEDPTSKKTLNELLASDSQILIVQGEAGLGKSAMSKYLFKWWMSSTTESVNELEAYDIALRVECCNVASIDVNTFYEDHLPNTSYSFPNTSSMSRHFREFRVLWIIDGFDEKSACFLDFFKGLMKRFPASHKLIITTRPQALEDLKQHLPTSSLTLSIYKLRDYNIVQIILNTIKDYKEILSFISEFSALDESSKTLLTLPLNLMLHIQLWLDNKCEADASYTTNMLFVKTIKLHLRRLIERSKCKVTFTSDDLKFKVKKWFFTLCKISFINILHCRFAIIPDKDVKLLKKSACDGSLTGSECLSAFLRIEGYGKLTYYYSHPLQQSFLAFFFLKEDGKNRNSSLDDILQLPSVKWDELYEAKILEIFINFHVKIIFEQNSSPQQIVAAYDFLRKLILRVKSPSDRCWLWYGASVAANFNVSFMKYVALQSPNFQYLNLTTFIFAPSIDKFLDHFHPQVIIFSVMNEASGVRSLFKDILNFVIDKRIECDCFIYQGVRLTENLQLRTGNAEMDLINKEPINVTHFIGSMGGLLKISKHHNSLKAVGVIIESESDLDEAMQFLRNHRSLQEIKFLIDFDFKQPFNNKNLYNFPDFKYYISELIKSHNKLIVDHTKPLEVLAPCLIAAIDIINASIRFRCNARQENTDIKIHLEALPMKYSKHIEISDILSHAKQWRRK